MKLEEFVSETIKQVINGVKDAQEHAKSVGAKVNPQVKPIQPGNKERLYAMESGGITNKVVQELEFDVAVTTQEDSEIKGGIGIFVGSVVIGTQGQSGASSSEINRIRFKVPLVLPEQS